MNEITLQLIELANKFRDADADEIPELVSNADRLTWAVYETGIYPDNDQLAFALREQLTRRHELPSPQDGFAETILIRWWRFCGTCPDFYSEWPPEDDDMNLAYEHGLRQFASLVERVAQTTGTDPRDRIEFDDKERRIRLDDAWHKVSEPAYALLKACWEEYPLHAYANKLDGDIRPCRVKESLPRELKAVFRHEKGKGCRLEL